MKKLNDIVPNELLFELHNMLDFDWIDDSVGVTFYANHKIDSHKIGSFYSESSIGEFLLEKCTVKAFTFNVILCSAGKSIDIDIVLNVKLSY